MYQINVTGVGMVVGLRSRTDLEISLKGLSFPKERDRTKQKRKRIIKKIKF